MDKGPWRVYVPIGNEPWGVFVESEDFEHDVRLEVTGDFATTSDHILYADWIAGVLNRAGSTSSGAT